MIIQGDCLQVLNSLPAQCVQTCITSPPYWGLRDYGVDGQLGLEESPDFFVEKMVEVFRGVRRVLKDDGTLWINLGDSYAQPKKDRTADEAIKRTTQRGSVKTQQGVLEQPNKVTGGLKRKDLAGIPWRVALALQADGWWLRQDIIWHKPNPMPESVTDRCTKSHEYLFLLAKSEVYYFDCEAIKEPANLTGKGNANGFRGGAYVNNSTFDNSQGGKRTKVGNLRPSAPKGSFNGKTGGKAFRHCSETRNKRSVWTVATRAFAGAHFATYPPALIKDCVLASTKPGDVILDPFFGAGTTGLVAQTYQREFLGIELNPEYAVIAKDRLQTDILPFKEIPA